MSGKMKGNDAKAKLEAVAAKLAKSRQILNDLNGAKPPSDANAPAAQEKEEVVERSTPKRRLPPPPPNKAQTRDETPLQQDGSGQPEHKTQEPSPDNVVSLDFARKQNAEPAMEGQRQAPDAEKTRAAPDADPLFQVDSQPEAGPEPEPAPQNDPAPLSGPEATDDPLFRVDEQEQSSDYGDPPTWDDVENARRDALDAWNAPDPARTERVNPLPAESRSIKDRLEGFLGQASSFIDENPQPVWTFAGCAALSAIGAIVGLSAWPAGLVVGAGAAAVYIYQNNQVKTHE
jgi:hypothetical protein